MFGRPATIAALSAGLLVAGLACTDESAGWSATCQSDEDCSGAAVCRDGRCRWELTDDAEDRDPPEDGDDGIDGDGRTDRDIREPRDTHPDSTPDGGPTVPCCLGNGKSCRMMAKNECLAKNGSVHGPGANCLRSDPCPTEEVACCKPGDECVQTSYSRCQLLSGQAYEGKSCEAVPTDCGPNGRWACCKSSPCFHRSEEKCESIGGTSFPGQRCRAGLCAKSSKKGACCDAKAQSCEQMTAKACRERNGTFHPGRSCSEVTCRQRTVLACCLQRKGDPNCLNAANVQQCRQKGGIPKPEATCESNACPGEYGACCRADGTCRQWSREKCRRFAPGNFHLGKTCSEVSCSGGACCENGRCRITTNSQCGGTFHPGESCGEADCQTGACCNPGDYPRCTMSQKLPCLCSGGNFRRNAACNVRSCGHVDPARGSCCPDRKLCTYDRESCLLAGGRWVPQKNRGCRRGNYKCTARTGACCKRGSCSQTTGYDCRRKGGKFAAGKTCSGANCQNVRFGACCVDETCVATAKSRCQKMNGTFHRGKTCQNISCTGACCAQSNCFEGVERSDCRNCSGTFHRGDTCATAPCP